MKIVVDKMPTSADNCLYSEYDGNGEHICTINKRKRCSLLNNKNCESLITFRKMLKNFHLKE